MVQYQRPRARRRLEMVPVGNAAMAARAIQAAARGFLARRRLVRAGGAAAAVIARAAARRRAPPRRLMSPMDIQRRFRRASRPQGQVVVPKVFPKYRIGSLIGTAKSKRKVAYKKVDDRVVRSHYDLNHEVEQTQVAYFGFTDAGALTHQLKQGCYALMQLIYKRLGIVITHPDYDYLERHSKSAQSFTDPDAGNIIIGFEIKRDDGGSTFDQKIMAPADYHTMESGAQKMMDFILDRSKEGYLPYMLRICRGSGGIYELDLQNIMVHFNCTHKIKWQNVTPAEYQNFNEGNVTVSNDLNNVNANPLSGRIYQFKGYVPKVRSHVRDAQKDKGDYLLEIEDAKDSQGRLLCEAFRESGGYSNDCITGFQQPFRGVAVFSNLSHEDRCYMPPGGYKQLIRKTEKTLNFMRFVQATIPGRLTSDDGAEWIPIANRVRVNRIGGSTLFAFEPAMRTAAAERTKIIVNRELFFATSCTVTKKKQPVRAITTITDGANFKPPPS